MRSRTENDELMYSSTAHKVDFDSSAAQPFLLDWIIIYAIYYNTNLGEVCLQLFVRIIEIY